MTTMLEIVKRNKKFIGAMLAFLVFGAIVVYVNFFIPKAPEPTTKPPVVSANFVTVVSSDPAGDIKTLNRLFSASVKFSENIGTDLSGLIVSISPSIGFNKYVVSAEPETLWIEPVSSGVDPGWQDDVLYTVIIRKGSTISNGAVLKEDYSFTFSNSTVGITMYAD